MIYDYTKADTGKYNFNKPQVIRSQYDPQTRATRFNQWLLRIKKLPNFLRSFIL
jgi:hypothetical protein